MFISDDEWNGEEDAEFIATVESVYKKRFLCNSGVEAFEN